MNVPRGFHKDVREVCEVAGWDVWSTYNDKHSDGSRRVSYARNGWRLEDVMKAEILRNTKKVVEEYGIKGARVEWTVSHKWGYGDYDKLCVHFPA